MTTISESYIKQIKAVSGFEGVEKFKFDTVSYVAIKSLIEAWGKDLTLAPKKTILDRIGITSYSKKLQVFEAETELFTTYNEAFSKCAPNRFVSKEIAKLFV